MKREIEFWIAEEGDCVYAKLTQVKVQSQLGKTLVIIFQLASGASSHKIKKAPGSFLELSQRLFAAAEPQLILREDVLNDGQSGKNQ